MTQRSTRSRPSEKRSPGRPPNDPQTTRDRLLATASELFNRDGYFGTDTNKIARRASLAPATLYKHFGNKLELFLAVYADWVNREWAVIQKASQAEDDDSGVARGVVRAMLRHHRRWRGVRASMHALIATDRKARRFGESLRREQIARTLGPFGSRRPPPLSLAERTFSFLSIERANNAITDGDLEAFGVDEKEFVRRLEEEVLYLMTGKRPF